MKRALPVAMLLAGVAFADAPARRSGPVERFDEDGRVIERAWPGGRLLQFTWDTNLERVVRIDGGTEKDGVTWTHCFEVDAAGALTREWDCTGKAHELDAKAVVDMDRGTAIAGHRHGGER